MPQVQSEIIIKAPLNLVWSIAQDVVALPDILADLDDVKVHEREELSDGTTRVVSEWHGRIKQFNRRIVWTEEDFWDEKAHTCTFQQIKGDFDEYSGVWKFEPTDDGSSTRALLDITYKFDVPLLGALLQKVVRNIMQGSADDTLRGVAQEAERRAA
jgi:ribosome-associated toxin RatA of RatAB toxin-antitoxin module